LILEIEKIANLYGMPVGNVKFDTKNLENKDQSSTTNNVIRAGNDKLDNLPYGIFPLEFEIEGRYDTFLSFLEDLELNLRMVDVKSISFTVPSATGSGSPSNIYKYTLKVETYWLK
jgi:hypothetical protein